MVGPQMKNGCSLGLRVAVVVAALLSVVGLLEGHLCSRSLGRTLM